MHFINKKIATGLDAPIELLPEMVPPSFRIKPALIEEAHISKEFEELQTQVTELQREKLYYEQRATEHDIATRQKRTELSHLELEMESIFKTLQEREMKKSEEKKRFVELEDRLIKVGYQLNDFRVKFELESDSNEKIKFQITHIDNALKSKDVNLAKIKNDLQQINIEQLQLENKLKSRNDFLLQLINKLHQYEEDIQKVICIYLCNLKQLTYNFWWKTKATEKKTSLLKNN
jgi:chromosome segregation ATPase